MVDSTSLKLLADGMLGRLAKWLRILGYDTVYDPHLDDNELVRRARAEGRVLLTRDHELAERPGVHSLLIESGELLNQLGQVRDRLGRAKGSPFSRCPVCNTPLVSLSPQEVKGHVPPFVLRSHSRFRRCPSCDKIYWPGSHWKRMREQIARLEGWDQALKSDEGALQSQSSEADKENREGGASGLN
ncbi:MAG: Mut7-C RNAse domain-containing protein [Chloroflexota bacterium]|nr:Mut7-C RNAse domain-containing protein [Chloroflexota bacterium]